MVYVAIPIPHHFVTEINLVYLIIVGIEQTKYLRRSKNSVYFKNIKRCDGLNSAFWKLYSLIIVNSISRIYLDSRSHMRRTYISIFR